MAPCAGPLPFRIFFFLAALDAVAGVAIWPCSALGLCSYMPAGNPISIWHRQELLFGMMPAVVAGFLLTALPRWTGSRAVSRGTVRALAGLWLAGRVAHGVAPSIAGPLVAVFVALLALMLTHRVIAAGNRRDIKIAVLLILFSAGAASAGNLPLEAEGEYGSRLGMAAVLGLLIILSGRIVPSLTAAYLGTSKKPSPMRSGDIVEISAAIAALIGLGAWVLAPVAQTAAVGCALAAVCQTARLLRWRAWQAAARPAILVLHVGYGWIPAGFALLAARFLHPRIPVEVMAAHAWTAGSMGLISLGVMASMIRRHTGATFASSAQMSAAYAFGFLAAVARLAADILDGARAQWLGLAAIAWIAAYILFLTDFRQGPLRRGLIAPLRCPMTDSGDDRS